MPDVRNCRRCGKIFTYTGGMQICHICKEQDEIDFRKVKEYLYNHPGATMSEVSSALEISVERIKGYLREGRLEIVGDMGNLILECESCGKAIRSGRFCDECSRGLASEMQLTAKDMTDMSKTGQQPNAKGVGMRYLNKDVRK
ncbi:MAG: MerR family transcriptional regulator [Clostridia bacterium]|nr:MerR family transcriptional regulator [Clostridia bacterium]